VSHLQGAAESPGTQVIAALDVRDVEGRVSIKLRHKFVIITALSAVALQAGCRTRAIRPEGGTQALTANAPAGTDVVFARAKQWYEVNRYLLSADVRDKRLRGYRTILKDGNLETRAVVEFRIKRSGSAETVYEIESRTEVGAPPAMRQAATNATEAAQAVSSLDRWLSCPAARWPGCS
jgi:hypothetical protein